MRAWAHALLMPFFPRPYRAGDTVEDLCRACKIDRAHTVIVAEPDGRPLRVQCDYCGSQHQFRGGGSERTVPLTPTLSSPDSARAPSGKQAGRVSPTAPAASSAWPLVSERERTETPVTLPSSDDRAIDLELLLRRIIREETGLTAVAPAEKWRGGSLVLKPGNPSLQEKSVPIETFFHKVVMIRNRLRTLEQQLNALDAPEDVKVKMQAYITGCYGSLTSFNILFASEDDQFRGSGE
jgi:hypothetical protein